MSELSTPSRPTSSSHARSAAFRSGALAAVGTWAVVVLPSLVGWLAAPESSVGWFSAVQVGSAVWFLGHGASVGGHGVVISLTPVLLLLVFTYVSVRWARRLVATERASVSRSDWSRVAKLGVVPGFLLGYVSVAAVIALLTLGGPVSPGVAAVPGTLLVPVLALAVLLLRPEEDDAPAFVRAWFRRGPTWLPSAWQVGWRGARALFLVGLALVALRLVWSFGEVRQIQGEYGLGFAGAAVAVLAQALFLGNATTWALAFLAGPGFQIATGSLISPAGATPGLMPLVPLLGALPDRADYPPTMFVVILVPVLVGVAIGRWVDAELEFFGNVRARLCAMATAAAIPAAAMGALAALGNGAIGVDRLSAVGVPAIAFTAALVAEVVAGALAWGAVATLRERREAEANREPEPQPADRERESGSGSDDVDPEGAQDATAAVGE